MARPKKEMYSREEVELITRIVMVQAMGGVNQMLLVSGAQPSKEVGVIIMHLAAGVKANNEVLDEAVKSLQLDDYRLKELQELANVPLK